MARADAMAKSMQAKDADSVGKKRIQNIQQNVYPMLRISMVLMNLRPYPPCGNTFRILIKQCNHRCKIC